jgi:outer membrane protein assembly complex protein YaeT
MPMTLDRRVFRWLPPLVLALSACACVEDGTVVVHSLTFKGVASVDQAQLQTGLATRPSARIPWGKKYAFDRSRFDADLKRIQAFYADRGYPDARVASFDVKLNDKGDRVDLTVTVEEGEPVRITALDFSGFDAIPADHLAHLKSRLPLTVGQPRDRQLVVAVRDMALNELKDHGYPYARVSMAETPGADVRHVALTFTAEPGRIARFGAIDIAGEKTVGENVIARQLTFKPGELFRRSLLTDSQRRLYGLQLFQFANVEPLNTDQQPEEVPIRVTVAEGKHHRVNLSGGYGSEDKLRADAEYRDVNFLGDARSAGAHVRWSSLDRGVRLDITQPYFFSPNYSLSADAQDWLTYTPAYNSTSIGARLTLRRRTSAQTTWAVSLSSEYDSSSISEEALNDPSLRNSLIALGLDPETGEQNGTVSAVGFDLQHSTADSLIDPHHGYQVGMHAEGAGRALRGTFEYTAVAGDARLYTPVGKRVVVAHRLQMGNIRPVADDETNIPFGKRYFLGGATSIRGWGRYEVSPLSESGEPIGGDSMLAFSEELRAIARGSLAGVLFLDAGNVWAKSWSIRLDDLRYAVGTGVRYQTPVGPLRVDVGYQLNPIPNLQVNGSPQTRRWRVHFSIGQAF